jgi:hypothetical protein
MMSVFAKAFLACAVGLFILTLLFRRRVPRGLLWLAIPVSFAIAVAGVIGLVVLPPPPFIGGEYHGHPIKPGPVIHGSDAPSVTKPSP